jgi:hypothetical protein
MAKTDYMRFKHVAWRFYIYLDHGSCKPCSIPAGLFHILRYWTMRNILSLIILVFCGATALAQWSPEILIWQNPPGVDGLYGLGYIAVDSVEHAHIAYTMNYFRPNNSLMHTGVCYTQFDNAGHQVVPPIFISDSLDDMAGSPIIRFFGQDSLWVMWSGSSVAPKVRIALQYVCLDLNGRVLHPVRDFVRRHSPSGMEFTFDVRADRTVVVADSKWESPWDSIYLTVQAPGGQRIMDDQVVFHEFPCDRPRGWIDHTDSLQLYWRQFPSWQATWAKRVDTHANFDTTQVAAHVELTPRQGVHAPLAMHPIGDSLLGLVIYDDPHPSFHLFQRDTYAEVDSGVSLWSPDFVIEGDSIIGAFEGNSHRDLVFSRYRLSDLSGVDNTIIVPSETSIETIGAVAAAFSPQGVRHLLYLRNRGTDPGEVRLCYRYWPDLPSAVEPHPPVVAEDYAVYPNPTNGMITLSGPLHQLRAVELYNLLGQRVRTIQPPANSAPALHIAMEGFPSGVYFLHLQEDDRTVIRKFQYIR